MEFLELLLASPEFCGCMIEVGAVLIDVWAGVAGYRYVKSRRMDVQPRYTGWTLTLVLFAVLVTVVVAARWIRRIPG